MSWGYRILIAYIAGVLFISFFVYKSMQVNIDLAEENYYEKELKFNDYAISKKNGDSIGGKVSVTMSQGQLKIKFDDSLVHFIQKPKIEVYYPVNKIFDKILQLNTPLQPLNVIDVSKLHKGYCIFKITFELQGQAYYWEHSLNI